MRPPKLYWVSRLSFKCCCLGFGAACALLTEGKGREGLAWQQTLTRYCSNDLGRLEKLHVYICLHLGGGVWRVHTHSLRVHVCCGGIQTCLEFHMQRLKDGELCQRGKLKQDTHMQMGNRRVCLRFWCWVAAGNDVISCRKCSLWMECGTHQFYSPNHIQGLIRTGKSLEKYMYWNGVTISAQEDSMQVFVFVFMLLLTWISFFLKCGFGMEKKHIFCCSIGFHVLNVQCKIHFRWFYFNI